MPVPQPPGTLNQGTPAATPIRTLSDVKQPFVERRESVPLHHARWWAMCAAGQPPRTGDNQDMVMPAHPSLFLTPAHGGDPASTACPAILQDSVVPGMVLPLHPSPRRPPVSRPRAGARGRRGVRVYGEPEIALQDAPKAATCGGSVHAFPTGGRIGSAPS